MKRIELNKDEKKKKRKFLQEIQDLYIIANDFKKHGRKPEGNIEKLNPDRLNINPVAEI